ncbi:DUF6817 domain-containing protein [Yinghuangia aomiensis]
MATADAVSLLRTLGAEDVAHPGGNLFDHLVRVHDELTEWGAPRELRLAGLCHALYGTDGFPVALFGLDRRAEVAALIGADAEALVYFYASCDRGSSYRSSRPPAPSSPTASPASATCPTPPPAALFAELTAANELDVVRAHPEASGTPELYGLLSGWRGLLSDRAAHEVERVLNPHS